MSRRKRAVVSPSCQRTPEKLKVTYEPTGEYHTLPDLAQITREDIRNLKRAGKAVAKQAAEAERLDAEQYAELMNAIGL